MRGLGNAPASGLPGPSIGGPMSDMLTKQLLGIGTEEES